MGRPSDIPAGVEREVMLAGMCAERGYRLLHAIKDFYNYKDLEGIFHHRIKLSQLNDDRFGYFLDDFYEAGCRNIFRENQWTGIRRIWYCSAERDKGTGFLSRLSRWILEGSKRSGDIVLVPVVLFIPLMHFVRYIDMLILKDHKEIKLSH